MHRKRIFSSVLAAVLLFTFTSCSNSPKENQVYEVKEENTKDISKIASRLNTEGVNPFNDFGNIESKLDKDAIPVAVTKDKKYLYVMTPYISKDSKDAYEVIKGEYTRKVNLVKLEAESKKTKVIVSGVPFISSAKWNKDQSILAFVGDNRLIIYNDKEDTLIQNFENNNTIKGFGWSPDGKRIYTEGPNLINDGIFYIDSKKYFNAYEVKDELYYKGMLDENYYIGTKREGNSQYNTVIIDETGKLLKTYTQEGRYASSYKRSLLQIGKSNFELSYYEDLDKEESVKVLSKEFINDAKFIYNGGIAFITPNDNVEDNSFYLHILNSKGEETIKLQVSGSKLLISPDGKTGYMSGQSFEKIDFSSNTLERSSDLKISEDRESIYRTLRGALDVAYKYEMTHTKDMDGLKKYYTDTHNPEQWAYTDMYNIFNTDIKLAMQSSSFTVNLLLKSLTINGDRATANVGIYAANSSGTGIGTSSVLELVKKDKSWYVTGLSTFPNSKQLNDASAAAEAIVEQAQEGKLFGGALKNKDVKLGQLQFWQLSDPHLADNIDYANYCKVYLRVTEDGKEVLYKLVIERKNQSYWKESTLSKERLGTLF